MRILIITTLFPPDTAIAAVRPYMFAKYLSKMGHDVTVIRPGIISLLPDDTFTDKKNGFRVISYLGEDSPADVFERTHIYEKPAQKKKKFAFLPDSIRKKFAAFYRSLKKTSVWQEEKKRTDRLNKLQYTAINRLADEHFDIVWATFGNMENINAGRYAASVFKCPWVLDFRDPIANEAFQKKDEYRERVEIQSKAIHDADISVAVSYGGALRLQRTAPDRQIEVIYNGYDEVEIPEEAAVTENGKLVFCYTGTVYKGRSDCSMLFKAISILADKGEIDINNIVFKYAGKHFYDIQMQARKYKVNCILHDNGYMGKEAVLELQAKSDVFVVLAWNGTGQEGVISGKFFEGIRCHKPILSIISGDLPDSEHYRINQKYSYGFCCEEGRGHESLDALCDWLKTAYDAKMSGNDVEYNPKPELFTDFRYDTLTKQLEALFVKLTGERQ